MSNVFILIIGQIYNLFLICQIKLKKKLDKRFLSFFVYYIYNTYFCITLNQKKLDMSTYTMAQIVTLTGIKAHTLRKWETRYSFLEPERTDTNIRYYSDNQLKKLLNIAILNRNGFRVSKINKMSEEEIHEIVASRIKDTNNEDGISALIVSMLEMDESKFESILKTQIMNNGLLRTMTELIYPFLNQVGVLWGINRIIPAQEHFISSLIKKKIFASIDILPRPHKDASSVIMFLPEYEHHEIGLLLAYYIASELNWKVYYLGQNVPIQNISETIKVTKPNAILTMFITPTREHFSDQVKRILEQSGDVPLLVSGNPELLNGHDGNEKLVYLKHPDELVEYLKRHS